MKKIINFVLLLILSVSVFSQSNKYIRYTYDNAGNRIQRKVIYLIQPYSYEQNKIDTLQEKIAEKNIKIYPNPVKEKLNIFIENYENEQGTVYVYALNGTLIKTKKIKSDKIKLDFNKQIEGTYIVKIKIANKTKEYTVIKKY